MAISHVLSQADGNAVRSSMSLVDFDGVDTNGVGSTLGLTITTTLSGVDVDAVTAELYTSAAILNNHDMVAEACNTLTAALAGAEVYFAQNTYDKFTIHVEALNSVADDSLIATPVLTVA